MPSIMTISHETVTDAVYPVYHTSCTRMYSDSLLYHYQCQHFLDIKYLVLVYPLILCKSVFKGTLALLLIFTNASITDEDPLDPWALLSPSYVDVLYALTLHARLHLPPAV